MGELMVSHALFEYLTFSSETICPQWGLYKQTICMWKQIGCSITTYWVPWLQTIQGDRVPVWLQFSFVLET